MALIGNKEQDTGVVANYHNISFIGWNKDGELTVGLSSYVDETARLAGKQFLVQKQYTSSVDTDALLKLIYNDIITNNELTGLVSDEV